MPITSARGSLHDADDATLADRASDGDIHAFEVLVRRYGALLRVVSGRVLGSTSEVDDVVQETFITAWQQLPTLENTKVVKSWLVRIASRKSIDRLRARREHDDIAQQEDILHDAGPGPEHVAEASSRQQALTRALATLPEDQRRSWVLKELSHYSYDDIARELDVPATTVRGLLVRARKNLIREMEAWR